MRPWTSVKHNPDECRTEKQPCAGLWKRAGLWRPRHLESAHKNG